MATWSAAHAPGDHSGDEEEVKARVKPTLYITAVMCVCVGAVELLSLVPGRMGGGGRRWLNNLGRGVVEPCPGEHGEGRAEMAQQLGPRMC